MRRILQFERALLSIETWCLIGLVALMLFLAGYNVAYRNLLVPLQRAWATSGPVIANSEGAAGPAPPTLPGLAEPQVQGAADPDRAGDREGFAGGLADPVGGGAEGFAGGLANQAGGDADGFAGGLAEEAGAGAEESAGGLAKPADGAAEGFAGGLAEQAGGAAEGFAGGLAEQAGGAAEGFAGGLTERAEAGTREPPVAVADPSSQGADPQPRPPAASGSPPEPGSWRAHGIEVIDALKLEWIDVLLRQLVIIVSFLGGMLATQRRKHINVDAMSRLFSPATRRGVDVIVNVLSVGVCIVLAMAGADLVVISREFPKALFPWADEWMFQLMFPIGFGMLAWHFMIRLLEAALALPERSRRGGAS
jgi:TRAP-type C4-dicarboxylate transport system permease small subunit